MSSSRENGSVPLRQWGQQHRRRKRSNSVLPATGSTTLGVVRELTPLRENVSRRARHTSLPPRLTSVEPVPIESLRNCSIYKKLEEQEIETKAISARLAAAISEGKRLQELEAKEPKVKTPKLPKSTNGPALAELVDLAERSLVLRPPPLSKSRQPLADLNMNTLPNENADFKKTSLLLDKKLPTEEVFPALIDNDDELEFILSAPPPSPQASPNSTPMLTSAHYYSFNKCIPFLFVLLIAFILALARNTTTMHSIQQVNQNSALPQSIILPEEPMVPEEDAADLALIEEEHKVPALTSTQNKASAALRLLESLTPQSRRRPLTPPIAQGTRGLFPLRLHKVLSSTTDDTKSGQ